MNQVNFLPATFIRERARRRRIRRQWMLVGVVTLCLLTWGFSMMSRNAALRRYAENLEAQAAAAEERESEMVKLRNERRTLEHQISIQRELSQPVSPVQVLDTMAGLLPPTVGMIDLQMETKRPRPARAAAETDKQEPSTGSGPNHIEIRFDGMAPDNLVVANVVAALSEHPLFHGVQLRYSRAEVWGNVEGRRFSLQTHVPLNREYRPSGRKELADAY